MVFCLVLGCAVLSRAGLIQLVRDGRLERMSKKQFQAKVLIRPRRGSILDRNGEPLAVNVETHSLAANPLKIHNKKTIARLLSKAAEIPYAKLLRRLKEKKEFVWIKRHMSDAELNRFKKFHVIDPDGDLLNGLWLVRESKRVYPHGELASHVLGSVNLDSEGLEGVELWQNHVLRGKVVSVNAVKDALGRPAFIDAVAANNVKDGSPVTLTLDASLQYSVEESLKNVVLKANAKGGAVIVMNAVTGEILAMANEPSFNPNDKGVPSDRRRNRVLTDGYEPGSTFKGILLSTALTHGWKLTDQIWGERGQFRVQGRKISEAETHEKFEWLTLKKIIQLSSNVGAAKLALKVGRDKYYSMIKLFGFGGRVGIAFPGEIPGYVPSLKSWQPLTLANIGFGQGVLVTPMQMIRAYAVFLNGGWLIQPTLLKDLAPNSKPVAPRRILSSKVSGEVVEALESVTQDGGTGVKANLSGYEVAGKTGTAQEVDPETHRYSRSRYVASFIGFAVGVEPKIVILTKIDEPHGVYYASETAAPLFREVLADVVNRFAIPAKAAPVLAHAKSRAAKAPAPFSAAAELTRIVDAKPLEYAGMSSGNPEWKMPMLKGFTAREAIRAMQGHRFHVDVRGEGLVQSQVPAEGKAIAEGDTIHLVLGGP